MIAQVIGVLRHMSCVGGRSGIDSRRVQFKFLMYTKKIRNNHFQK